MCPYDMRDYPALIKLCKHICLIKWKMKKVHSEDENMGFLDVGFLLIVVERYLTLYWDLLVI